MYPGHHASFPRRSQPLSATGSQASAMPLGMVHVPSLPQPLSRQPPLRGGGLFIGAAMSNAVKTRQREISAQHPPNSKRHSRPKRAPAAQPPQQRTAGYTHPRETKAKHPAQAQAAQPTQTRTGGKAAAAAPGRTSAPTRDKGHAPTPIPSGTANPNAHRRPKPPQQRTAGYTHQRETKAKHPAQSQAAQPTQTRTGGTAAAAAPSRIYAPNAKLRAPASASGRITPPNAGHRAPTTRTRQRRAAQAAQTAVGDAQLRILLRDDHVQSLRQRKVTSHQAKSAFLWGYPRFFWQDKRNGVQKTKQGAYSGVLLFYFFSCIVFRSSPQACGCSRSRRSCRGK